MLRVNQADGKTISYNLLDSADAARWQHDQNDRSYQANVTGLAVLWEGELHTLPLPKLYRVVTWSALLLRKDAGEPIGIAATVQADDTRTVLTVYFNGPVATRTDLQKVGKQRFIPS